MVIGKNEAFADLQMGAATGEERFGTIPRSMYSLFELMTLEGWHEVGRPLVMKQPLMFFFLFSFIMIFTFGLLNMIVGMVVEKTMAEARKMEELDERDKRMKMAKELAHIKKAFLDADADGSGMVTAAEFEEALQSNEEVLESLHAMHIPQSDARELFWILDADNSGSLNLQEFLDGILKVRGAIPTHWDIIATYAGVRRLNTHAQEAMTRLPDALDPKACRSNLSGHQESTVDGSCATTGQTKWQAEMLHVLQEQSKVQSQILSRLDEQAATHVTMQQRLADLERHVGDMRSVLQPERHALVEAC